MSLCFTQQLFIWNCFAEGSGGNATQSYFNSLSLHEFLSLEQLITFCCCIIALGGQNVEFALLQDTFREGFHISYRRVGISNHRGFFWADECKRDCGDTEYEMCSRARTNTLSPDLCRLPVRLLRSHFCLMVCSWVSHRQNVTWSRVGTKLGRLRW